MAIYINCEQGESEWFKSRLGIPTSSNFKKIITIKGTKSTQRWDYIYQLASERVTGEIYGGFYSEDMERGKIQEEEARGAYEFETDTDVKLIGCVYKDDSRQVLCSPDGLVSEDGGTEFKSANQKLQVKRIHKPDTFISEHFQQVQGCLYVTGRKWWDLVSYSPMMKLLIIRIEPDLEWFKLLERELEIFLNDLKEAVEAYERH